MTSIVAVCAILCRWVVEPTATENVFGAVAEMAWSVNPTAAVASLRERDLNVRVSHVASHAQGESCTYTSCGHPGQGGGRAALRVNSDNVCSKTPPEPAVNDQAEVTTALITIFEACPGSHGLSEARLQNFQWCSRVSCRRKGLPVGSLPYLCCSSIIWVCVCRKSSSQTMSFRRAPNTTPNGYLYEGNRWAIPRQKRPFAFCRIAKLDYDRIF